MSDSSVPTPTFGPNGYTAPADQDVLNGVLADTNAAFGGNMRVGLSTPQGQLAQTQTAAIQNFVAVMLQLMNGVDPALADGRMQDAIARIYFLTRLAASATLVTAQCVGAAGTIIPPGALAQGLDKNLYQCVNGGEIPTGGSILLDFVCQTLGPIACPAGSLTRIYQAVPGWDSITNPADGVPGINVESRAAFEARRQATVAKNSKNTNVAVMGALLGDDDGQGVSGVVDAYVVDNPTSTNTTIGGVTVLKNSLYVCVLGGTDQDVANAIQTKKAPGCGYTGNTTVSVVETSPLYATPPTYSVTFERPTALPIFFAVSLVDGPDVPSDAATQVQNAILGAFNGTNVPALRARIGSTLLALRYAGVIQALGSWARLETLTIGVAADPTGNHVAVNINQNPTCAAANIDVSLV